MARTATIVARRSFVKSHPKLVDVVIVIGYEIVIAVSIVHSILIGVSPLAIGSLGLLCTAGIGTALYFRRHAPIVVLAAVFTLVMIKDLALDYWDWLGLALAFYSTAAHLPPRRAGIAIPTVLAAVIIVVLLGDQIPIDYASDSRRLVVLLNSAVFASLLGFLVRALRTLAETRQARLDQHIREREQAAELTATRQRTALSRDMHDVVGHSLTAIINVSDGALRTIRKDTDASREGLERINRIAREALSETREILGALRPDGPVAPRMPAKRPILVADYGAQAPGGPASEPLPVESPSSQMNSSESTTGIRPLLDNAESTGLKTTYVVNGEPPEGSVDAEMRTTMYRIVQEAITNTMRHGTDPSRLDVIVTYDPGQVSLQIIDDGKEVSDTSTSGTGLRGARERAVSLGGELHYGATPTCGWYVTATIPLKEMAS